MHPIEPDTTQQTDWVDKLRVRYVTAASLAIAFVMATWYSRELQRRDLRRFLGSVKTHEQVSGQTANVDFNQLPTAELGELERLEKQLLLITVVLIAASFVAIFEPVARLLRRQWEAQRALNRELSGALNAAEEASQHKNRFLANMSHEIRTPMNGVIGLTDELLRTELSDGQKANLRMVKDSADALLELLNDILDHAKLRDGKIELEPRSTNLHDLAELSLAPFWEVAQANNNQLSLTVDSSIPNWVMVDAGRLRQVLANLVSNAIKFTRDGTVDLTVELMEQSKDSCLVEFSVRDSGIGIPAEKHGTIFEEFQQADASTTREFGGTGLGLSISRDLVRKMGSDIHVESTEGCGACFQFKLQLSVASAPPNEHLHPCATPVSDSLRLLVAEDSTVNQVVARLLLERMGHDATFVTDGQQAIEVLERSPFDAVLMDVHMPVLDGLEAATRIRGHESDRVSHTPIIAVTASVMRDECDRCLAAGMNDVLAKPIELGRLSEVLTKYVSPTQDDSPGLLLKPSRPR